MRLVVPLTNYAWLVSFCNFIKKRLQHMCFLVKFLEKICRIPLVAASDCYQLTGLVSNFFSSFMKIIQSHSQIRKKSFPNLLSESYKRKKLTKHTSRRVHTRHYYTSSKLICFSDVFFYFKNVFISHLWEVNNFIAWVKPVVWNCEQKL